MYTKKCFFENLGIVITFDSLNGFSSLDPKNEALGLLLRFLTFKHEIIFWNENIFLNQWRRIFYDFPNPKSWCCDDKWWFVLENIFISKYNFVFKRQKSRKQPKSFIFWVETWKSVQWIKSYGNSKIFEKTLFFVHLGCGAARLLWISTIVKVLEIQQKYIYLSHLHNISSPNLRSGLLCAMRWQVPGRETPIT